MTLQPNGHVYIFLVSDFLDRVQCWILFINLSFSGQMNTFFKVTMKEQLTKIAAETVIKWNVVNSDPGNNYDVISGAFVVPSSGYYEFTVMMRTVGQCSSVYPYHNIAHLKLCYIPYFKMLLQWLQKGSFL